MDNKKLLLTDLCPRLPYGVKVRYSSYKEFITCTILSINPFYNNVYLWSKNACFNPVDVSKIKPYLFPLSSMIEEQKKELQSLMTQDSYGILYHTIESFDYLNKNHFDYRGLIEKGLAIDATGLDIY